MSITPNKETQQNSGQTEGQRSNNQNGIVTVNDENNPTPEQRDEQIPHEPGTRRLRSERQSAEEGKRSK